MPHLKVILALGRVAHTAVIRVNSCRQVDFPFIHGKRHILPKGTILFDSYHCSLYNTATRRLTADMFDTLLENINNQVEL
jgi:uracil-DNA glycosylase